MGKTALSSSAAERAAIAAIEAYSRHEAARDAKQAMWAAMNASLAADGVEVAPEIEETITSLLKATIDAVVAEKTR